MNAKEAYQLYDPNSEEVLRVALLSHVEASEANECLRAWDDSARWITMPDTWV